MKKIFITLIIISTYTCKAQSPIISTVDWENDDNGNIELTQGCYLKDVENKFFPFLGTWKWINGNSILEIQFEKIEMVYNGDYYSDMLVGKYRFVDSNGIEKHNSLNVNLNNQNVWGYSYYLILGSGYYTDTTFGFQITDMKKNAHCNLKFNLLTPTQAEWKIWRYDGKKQPSGFTFPEDLILTKQ
ncbi:DUF6705 family protein [Flavobacterium sp.]|uniref:DUF6705 family protein n=1 Tax=Flavobacterium sp. TaxID=239 RepID=UPI0040472C21